MRFRIGFIALLLAGSTLSSCTCHQQMPEVAQAPTRPAGFQSSRPTAMKPTAIAPPTLPPTPAAGAPSPAAGAELPPDFPSDVAMMEGFAVTSVAPAPKAGHNIQFSAEQERQDIYQHYDKDLRAKGWQPEQAYEGKDQSFLNFRKGKTMVLMTISNDPRHPGKRIVSMLYYEDEPPEFGEF